MLRGDNPVFKRFRGYGTAFFPESLADRDFFVPEKVVTHPDPKIALMSVGYPKCMSMVTLAF